MTREEAIRFLSVHSSTNGSGLCTDKQHYEAKQMAIKALEQEPKFIAKSDGTIEQIKNCDDCLFKKEWEKIGKLISVVLEKQNDAEYHGTEDMDGLYYCPICQQTTTVVKDGKCPKCGATMDELSTREQTEDAISRQAAIEKIHWLGLDNDTTIMCDLAIRALPSVNPQEPSDISNDGTLTVNVEDGRKISRVLVCGANHWGGLYYPDEQEPKTGRYEKHIDHTDCIWYGSDSGCPVTCSQYRDGWNDAMDYIFKNGKGYQPYRHDD